MRAGLRWKSLVMVAVEYAGLKTLNLSRFLSKVEVASMPAAVRRVTARRQWRKEALGNLPGSDQ